ncbi:MAG: hypothetical protein LBO64_00220 [Desulfovibrio sp.]|jgi:hypothetical protein|nr:hypothetical protein [Desulfovibrio sp.]
MPNSSLLQDAELDASKIRKKDKYRLADVIELTCLQNADHAISVSEGLDEQLGDGEALGGIYLPEEEDGDHANSALDAAEQADGRNLFQEDMQSHMLARSSLFGDMYPFFINENFVSLKETPSASHKIYVFMLLASNLAFWDRAYRQLLAADFEILAAFSIRQIFPRWRLKLFGTARCAHLDAYTGSPREKIEAFAADTGLRLLVQGEELQRRGTSGGDAGIDVAAWHPFDDGAAHMPVLLAQVGCTADEQTMLEKQYSTNMRRWASKLHGLMHLGCMITPQCYRDTQNSWPCFTDVQSVFLDRFRVLRLLAEQAEGCYALLQCRDAVESIFF